MTDTKQDDTKPRWLETGMPQVFDSLAEWQAYNDATHRVRPDAAPVPKLAKAAESETLGRARLFSDITGDDA